ncbi:unnamed protein product [Oikopleura dioica]|uniref:Hexosyltransferase n=1 Tax=Oikopleura dioica TaxID=34765 RepID=E4WWE5_OIKDI|nr:unnamed protein product [Oikopleura dioica]
MRDHEDTRAFFNYDKNEFEHPVEHLNAFLNFEFGYTWPVLHKPSNCTKVHGFNQTTVLIGVKSHPSGIEKRNLIRRTWSQARYWTNQIFGKTPIQLKTIFLVGSTPTTDLRDEAEEYNDIYQWDFTEDLFNLTNKDHQLITFFENHCSFANFIVKADDDIFLNPKVIQRLIVKNLFDPKRSVNGTYRNIPTGQLVTFDAPIEMFGSMVIGAKPFRDPLNKYFIPNSFYSDAFGEYPKYFSGALFVMTNRALSLIGPKARETPAFPIDDVWVGMVLERAGLDNHLSHEYLMYIGLMNEQEMKQANLNNTCFLAGMPTYHRLNLEVIEMTYKMIYSMNLEKCMDESILYDVVGRFYKKSQFIARELIQGKDHYKNKKYISQIIMMIEFKNGAAISSFTSGIHLPQTV